MFGCPEGSWHVGRSGPRFIDAIAIDCIYMGQEGVQWIRLAQEMTLENKSQTWQPSTDQHGPVAQVVTISEFISFSLINVI